MHRPDHSAELTAVQRDIVRLGILGPLPDDYGARLANECPGTSVQSPEDDDIDMLCVWRQDVDEAVRLIGQHPHLRWVHTRWAGVPPRVIEALGDRPIPLTNGSGAHGPAIGEYVVGMIMAHLKGFHAMRAGQLRSEWIDGFTLRELRGLRVGVIGLGDLGGSTARVLKPFGVHLRALRRSGAASPDVDEVFSKVDEFLDGLDILVVAAPLTRETNGLLGQAQLERLAKGALLVNVGRAAIVDQTAMLEALRSGQLGGAALDVFLEEPLPTDSPLWQMPNVYISPHCADASPQSLERGFQLFLANVQRFQRGEPLHHVVDRSIGY